MTRTHAKMMEKRDLEARVRQLKFDIKQAGENSNMTAGQVENWEWVISPKHKGKVPRMTREEQLLLSYWKAQDWLPPEKSRLLQALKRKEAYRRKKLKNEW